MKERIITALGLAFVVLVCMFLTTSPMAMFALLSITAMIAGYEWYKLMPKTPIKEGMSLATYTRKEQNNRYLYAVVVVWVSILLMTLALMMRAEMFIVMKYILALISIFWFFSIYWVKQYPAQDQQWYNKGLYSLGCILISVGIFAVFFLWLISPWWLMYLFLLVWGADTGAYFVGRKFGKTKLSPNVSPNKTIEGLIGGILTTIAIIIITFITEDVFQFITLNLVQWCVLLVISIISAVLSVQGDLFESMVKRRAGIKDSGRILPGHGGVLDRIDSLMAAAPVFLLGLYSLTLMGARI